MVARRSSCMLLAAFAVLACKPEENQPPLSVAAEDAAEVFAREVCAALSECGCPVIPNAFASQDDCEAQLSVDYAEAIDPVLAAGGTWNAECAGQLVETWSRWGCLGPAQATQAGLYDPALCPILKGELELGADCSWNEIGDQCREGLTCVAGSCVEVPAIPVPLGEMCRYNWQELPCEAGAWCSGDGICEAKPAAGDPCDPTLQYLCGEPSDDLFCGQGSDVCEPAPRPGEPCFDMFLCGPGTYCDGGEDFTCQPKFELGDSCSADAVCPVDAACVGNTCEADPPAACGLAGFL